MRSSSAMAAALVCAAAIGGPGLMLGAGPATAAPAALTVHLTDGVARVQPHTSLTYTVTVQSSSDAAVRGRVVLDLPAYAHVASAGQAQVRRGSASWVMRIPAGKTVTRTATVTLGEIPDDQLRVIALASVYLGRASDTPVVRIGDADRIRGVVDPTPPLPSNGYSKHRPAAVHRSGRGAGSALRVVLPSALAVVAAGGGLAWWWRRRRAAGDRHDPELGRAA